MTATVYFIKRKKKTKTGKEKNRKEKSIGKKNESIG